MTLPTVEGKTKMKQRYHEKQHSYVCHRLQVAVIKSIQQPDAQHLLCHICQTRVPNLDVLRLYRVYFFFINFSLIICGGLKNYLRVIAHSRMAHQEKLKMIT
jgi:hypothetical protein